MRSMFCLVLLAAVLHTQALSQTAPDIHFFDSDGVPIRYVDLGTGEPVLLIHGFGGRLEFWEATGIASRLVAAGLRVVAYDVRGHGQSGKPHDPAQYGLQDVEDARRLLDHLSLERANVVGYSRGAEIASQLISRYPNRIRRVVFGGWGAGNPVERLSSADCLATADLLAREAFPAPLVRALQPPGAPLPGAEQQAQFTRELAAGNDMRALAASFQAGCAARKVTSDMLRATAIPVLAIVGVDDGMASSAQVMATEIGATAELSVIQGTNHITAPGHSEFVAELLNFMTDTRDVRSNF